MTRTVGAALFLAIWPWLFDTAVSLTNLFTSSLLGSGRSGSQRLAPAAAGLARDRSELHARSACS